jgi:hypothetical protein
MLEKINEPIDCIVIYKKGNIIQPYKVRWRGIDYQINKIGYHHRQKEGRVLFHIFSVATNAMDFRLRHDPENLSWVLEEVSDGFVS